MKEYLYVNYVALLMMFRIIFRASKYSTFTKFSNERNIIKLWDEKYHTFQI